MRLHLSGNVSEKFVSLYLGSHTGRGRLIKNAKWAVNQASINQEDVKGTPISLPSLEEQVEISAVLAEQMIGLESQLRTIEISLKQSATQRKNILKAAFSGQLASASRPQRRTR
jgi:type I restriction enzyme, S subunit